MLSNSQQNLKRLQSLKFFQFLNQISPQLLQNCLNSDIYNRIYHTLAESDATVIVNQQQLTSEVFCQLFSKCYEGCISSYADIAHYYCEINDIMMEKYCRENKMWVVNKNCFFSIYSQEAIEDYSLQLKQQFKIVLFQSEYSNMIAYINHVLMSIYLPTKENLSIFEQFCAQLSQYNIYQKVCRAIKQNICFEESYKFLIFLIDGFYYFPSLKQLIYKQQKNDNNLGDIFNIALAKLTEGGLDSLPKVQIISFLNVMVRHRIECAEKLVQILELNDNLKVVLAQGQKFSDVNIPHLQQLSELLLFLVKRNPKKPVKLYLSSQKVSQVQTFAIVMLKRGRSEFYQSSILLINEIIKYNIVGDDDQDVKIVLKALETDNYSLRKAALLVLESGFAFGKEDIVEVFLVKREKYFNMLHEFLREPFGEGCQSTHFLCLQIIHLLVTSNFSNNFIIEQCINEILICLAAPLNLSNLFHNFISQIIKKVCFRSYKNERKNKYQNYINFTTILKIMLSSLYMPDDFTKIMQISSNNFPNKIIITNLIQSLSYLFQRSNVLKLVEYNMIAPSLLQEIDHVLTILLEVIIKISVDGKLMQYFKSQITQQSQKKANILTILFNTLQNICYLFKNANLIFKQRIFKHRQLLLSQIYKLMPVKQLQSNKIPIVIKYTFSFAIEDRIYQLDRFLPIAVPFNDYKSYCLSLIQDKIRRFNHRQLFLGIFFRDVTHGNAEIKDEIGYKRMILRYLENRNTEFNATIEIIKDHNAPISPTRPNHFIPSHTYSSPISSFRGTVNTMNNSSLRFQGPLRSRSPSPFRPTQSRVIPGPYMCELCNRNPTSPHERTCSICNRR